MGHVNPTFNLKKKTKQNKTKVMKIKSFTGRDGERETVRFFFIFSFKSSFFDSRVSDRRISSGQTRKVLYTTRAARGNQKQGISPRIQVKIRKNPSF